MQGYLSLVLHAHLPFVRHPEHERFLEESWLFEAITETYLPLIQVLEGWDLDGVNAHLTLTVSPALCSMLLDPLLQERYLCHLDGLIELVKKERIRTHLDPAFHEAIEMYCESFTKNRETWLRYNRNLVGAFQEFHERGRIEIITTAATHAVLPLLSAHPSSLRAQILVARDHFRYCFGSDPRGFWLPECAYAPEIEAVFQEANIRWFIVDTHGLLHSRPRPRYGVFAPVFTPGGLAAFGRDLESAKQVWSRLEGYPGDEAYRDFYRDIGFDLDHDYVKPYLPGEGQRGFTGIKYYRITGANQEKQVYDRKAALKAVAAHAEHFLNAREKQIERLAGILGRLPIIVSPYDAELFGHWWYEGPEFLDALARLAATRKSPVAMITPSEYLREHPTHQVATPGASSWGEEGYWKLWLNETNAWIYPHLDVAQQRMTELAGRFPHPTPLQDSALKQAARELLLAQSSDWPFILRTNTSPDYARKRVTDHLLRFSRLYEQLSEGRIDEDWLNRLRSMDNIFPEIEYRYWAKPTS